MTDLPVVSNLVTWLQNYYINFLWSVAVLVLHMFIVKVTLPKIKTGVQISRLTEDSTRKAFYTIKIIVSCITIACLLIVWGLDFSGLLLISTSIITVTGAALFASWSILSNITAYFILLFQPSFSRGNFIRIIDGDNYLEGTISEVNLFNIKLISHDKEVISYPNNILLTKITILNPTQKMSSFGKITAMPPEIAEAQKTDK